ncbi:MAG: type II toxin-antitoxin system PrlF family antitoxin [Aphanizomenon sp.]|jgi:antitoxin PrlF
MKVKLRNNANSSRTAVNRSSKYIVVYHKKGETLGMNKILHPTIEKHSFVKAFLDLLARDINKNPNIVEPLTEDMYRRASVLTEGMEVDLDEEFPEDFIFV